MQALVTMKQGNMPVEEFNTKFIIKGNTAGLDFGDTIQVHQGNQNITIPNPHLVTLINLYERALSPKLANQIIMNGAPETISGWMSRAAEVDSAQRRTHHTFSQGVKGYGKTNWKPRLYQKE